MKTIIIDGIEYNLTPKARFKKGDWVVTSYGKVNQVVSVDKDGDGYTLDDGVYFSGSWCDMYHLWTIRDVKDGDVLAASDGSIFIFKETVDGGCKHYFALEKDNETINVNYNLEHFWETARGVKPSTKEQRDLLFQKMKEAGYEWDVEKKELKKIEQKSDFYHHEIDFSNCSEEYRKAYYDGWNNCNQQIIKDKLRNGSNPSNKE